MIGVLRCDYFAAERNRLPNKFTATIGGFFGPSYAVEFSNGILRYTEQKMGPGSALPVVAITPTKAQWNDFRRSLDRIDVWRWHEEYTRAAVLDGAQWSFEIEYADRAIKAEGSNDYPDEDGASASETGHSTVKSFDRFLECVEKLLGGKAFK